MQVRIIPIGLLFFFFSCDLRNSPGSEHTANFIMLLEQGEKVKIVTLGTSLTGGTWRWVDVMTEWLEEAYPGQVYLENLGVGASASMTVPFMEGNEYIWKKCGLDRIPEAIAAKPDVVFIEFAVNDAYVAYEISVMQSRKNLESMIRSLQEANPGIEIILQTMNLIIDMPELGIAPSSDRPDLLEYHEMYRQVAEEYGIQIIDHYPNWKEFYEREGKEEFLKLVTDGIHPNLEGYRNVLLPELRKELMYE